MQNIGWIRFTSTNLKDTDVMRLDIGKDNEKDVSFMLKNLLVR